jgi:hypothetical protein
MHMSHGSRSILQLALALFFFCSAPVASAASYTLAPLLIDREAMARDILNETIVLENRSGAKVTLFPSVNDVTVGLQGGVEEFIPPSMSDKTGSLATWIEVPRAGLELEAGERREIPLTIRVVPNAEPGTYHAMIAYAPGRTQDEALALIKAGAAPTTLINLTIGDDTDEAMRLSRFSVDKFVIKPSADALSFELINSGDTELKPTGDVIIYDQRGVEQRSFSINEDGAFIPPGGQRGFTHEVPIEGLFGKYKAFLSVRYGENQAAIYDTVYFYVFPWHKLLIAFGIFLAAAVGLALYLHNRLSGGVEEEGDEVPLLVRETGSGAHERDVVIRKKEKPKDIP